MPGTLTNGPEEMLAQLLGLAQMSRDANNMGRCGEPGEYCFQLFAAPMTIARTGEPAVDVAMETLRESLLTAWQAGRAAVVEAAAAAFPGKDWDVEFTPAGDNIQMICTQPS